ncbi:hypothetical protein BD31_I0888 [Candidatus Nitrosopumilus salaria BD31]|uniref:Uncharacterized protein n=1 Tax=Candidatus Nitrosopumilus salarius BD31 TaxID=859350 RepID=I3CZM6_9ARCH|nr:hypothetical protein BD31_I0888 [Candidatus Nitrosopumilus salaria BD31]
MEWISIRKRKSKFQYNYRDKDTEKQLHKIPNIGWSEIIIRNGSC